MGSAVVPNALSFGVVAYVYISPFGAHKALVDHLTIRVEYLPKLLHEH